MSFDASEILLVFAHLLMTSTHLRDLLPQAFNFPVRSLRFFGTVVRSRHTKAVYSVSMRRMETHLSTQTHTGACEQRRSPSQNKKSKAVGMKALEIGVCRGEREARKLPRVNQKHPFRNSNVFSV